MGELPNLLAEILPKSAPDALGLPESCGCQRSISLYPTLASGRKQGTKLDMWLVEGELGQPQRCSTSHSSQGATAWGA